MTNQSEAESKPKEKPLLSYAVSGGISAAALALAIAHVSFPQLKIDQLTVILLVVGALPWLAPLFKSIELPGGWKFQFQELQERLDTKLKQTEEQHQQLESRVQRVEHFAFSGALTDETKQRLNQALAAYHGYLKERGLDPGDQPPSVFIPPEPLDNAYFDPAAKQIVIGQSFVGDNDVMFHEYTHHALMNGVSDGFASLSPDSQALESGLADYLPCSFKNEPAFAPGMAATLNPPKPYLRNMINGRTVEQVMAEGGYGSEGPRWAIGEVWSGAFWQVRDLLGAETADGVIVSAWLATHVPAPGKQPASAFIDEVEAAVRAQRGQSPADAVRAFFTARGLGSRAPARRASRAAPRAGRGRSGADRD